MKDVLLITFTHLFFAVAVCHGQEQNIVPVTPEAAALSKMVNYPVAMYTGIPDISIPLYEIKSGEIVLPITLQYHAGGFKVNEKHTREGLGWSLGCDLQVTRTINGSDDFGPNGYARSTLVTSSPFVFYSKQELFPSARNYRMAVGEIDGQPDKFSYRLLGKSGSFFILKNSTGTSYSFVPVPSDNIKIEMIGRMFVITDSDGTVYYFEGEETTSVGPMDYRMTSWKCTRIVDNLGIEVFSFEYVQKAEVANKTSTDWMEYYSAHSYNSWNYNSYGGYYRSDRTPLSGYTEYDVSYSTIPFYRISNPKYIQFFANETSGPILYVPYYNTSTGKLVDIAINYSDPYSRNPFNSSSKIRGLALSKITFRGGKVDFTGTEQLSKIQVSDAKNQIVKTISFYHSHKIPIYSTAAKTYNGYNFNGTMYLDSIKLGAGSSMYETYAFLYNNKYCFGDHLVGNDAWGFPNETTKEKAYPGMTFAVPSKIFNETYHLEITGFPNSTRENLSYTTSGSNWSLASNEQAMRRGVLKRIIYPTGGFVDFDFEANSYKENFLVFEGSDIYNELPQSCGGLRVRSISFYEKGGTKPVSQKYYTYGEYEEGTGEMANRPKFNHTGKIRNMEAVDVVQYVANWFTNCGEYNPCYNRSSLNLMSIEKKTSLYPASILDYTYANGTSVYYTKVTEYSIDRGISSGKKVYTFYPPRYFHASFNEHNRIPETLVSYIKTNLFLGAQKSISEFEFVSPVEWKLKNRKTFEYEKQMKSEVVQAAYSTFRIIHSVKGGSWPTQNIDLYNDNYSINDAHFSELGGEYTYGTYNIPIGKLLLKKETEERLENGQSTMTTTEYTYKRLQPSEIKTTSSNGERYTKHLTYPFDLDGVYDQMEAKNMLGQVVQERIVNTGTGAEVMRKKTNYAVKADIGGILPSTVETSYGGGNAEVETTYDKYDQYGNILQMTGKDQTPVTYLWGYQGLYPVAQLRGVQYAQIPVTYTASATINDPASDTALRTLLIELKNSFYGKEQVSGYTYKRLTGMTSHFDEKGAVTYYEYDPYGRLATVKDHNQNPVGSYTYKTDNSPKVSLTPFWVNTPVMATVYDDIYSNGRSYNAIMLGGEVFGDYDMESCNMTVINRLVSGQGIHFYPDGNDTAPTASLQLTAHYYPNYSPSFPSRIDIDLLKDGHVVYTTTIPVNNAMSNMSLWKRPILYIPAGTYQISIRPDKNNKYEDTGVLLQIFRESQSSNPDVIMNLSTITLEGGKAYMLTISDPI